MANVYCPDCGEITDHKLVKKPGGGNAWKCKKCGKTHK